MITPHKKMPALLLLSLALLLLAFSLAGCACRTDNNSASATGSEPGVTVRGQYDFAFGASSRP